MDPDTHVIALKYPIRCTTRRRNHSTPSLLYRGSLPRQATSTGARHCARLPPCRWCAEPTQLQAGLSTGQYRCRPTSIRRETAHPHSSRSINLSAAKGFPGCCTTRLAYFSPFTVCLSPPGFGHFAHVTVLPNSRWCGHPLQ
jgi:hypothetical protein